MGRQFSGNKAVPFDPESCSTDCSVSFRVSSLQCHTRELQGISQVLFLNSSVYVKAQNSCFQRVWSPAFDLCCGASNIWRCLLSPVLPCKMGKTLEPDPELWGPLYEHCLQYHKCSKGFISVRARMDLRESVCIKALVLGIRNWLTIHSYGVLDSGSWKALQSLVIYFHLQPKEENALHAPSLPMITQPLLTIFQWWGVSAWLFLSRSSLL